MLSSKQDILHQLRQEILPLQGYRPPAPGAAIDMGLGPIAAAFPNGVFPTGAVHEFLSASSEDAAATCGFVAGILASLMQKGGACLWVSTRRMVFPPALMRFGIEAHNVLFIDVANPRDALWVMEEALHCEGLAAVVGEIRDADLTVSRKLQLAVEKSRVTGLLLRHQPRQTNPIATVARWRVRPQPSVAEDGLPGVGFPRWNVELLRVRNGQGGSWPVEWRGGGFRQVHRERSWNGETEEERRGSADGRSRPDQEWVTKFKPRKTG